MPSVEGGGQRGGGVEGGGVEGGGVEGGGVEGEEWYTNNFHLPIHIYMISMPPKLSCS
jgi:hypothetical protein